MQKILRAFRQSLEACLDHRMMLLMLATSITIVSLLFLALVAVWDIWIVRLTHRLQNTGVFHYVERWVGIPQLANISAAVFILLMMIPITYMLTAIFVGVFVAPRVLKKISEDFPYLQKKGDYRVAKGLGNILKGVRDYGTMLLASVPFWFIPGLQILIPMILTIHLHKNIFLDYALEIYGTDAEKVTVAKRERGRLWGMGLILGALSYLPLGIFFVPTFAAFSFMYFGLNELSELRRREKTWHLESDFLEAPPEEGEPPPPPLSSTQGGVETTSG